MEYVITALEGIITFISPCALPMLPIYITYFAGGTEDSLASGTKQGAGASTGSGRALSRAFAFVLGFTLIFTCMGVFAGTLSQVLIEQKRLLSIVCGALVVCFGLSYLEIIRLPFFRGMKQDRSIEGILDAFIFGLIYAVSMAPCAGAFLGSALMLAGTSGTVGKGALLLVCYSLGLGIPFLISAVLLDRLKTAFDFIKRNYRVINIICGAFLIVMGVLMITGHFGSWLQALSL